MPLPPHECNQLQWNHAGFHQLRLRRSPRPIIEAATLPAGYALRTFKPGDEENWLEILQQGGFDLWDRPRLERLIAGERTPLPKDAIFFAVDQDRPVGVANIFGYETSGVRVAELGWVAVHPDHRGHGLCRPICAAAMRYAANASFTEIYLETEDFRLAAIKTYLRLGFEPEMTRPDHPERWKTVRRLLGLT